MIIQTTKATGRRNRRGPIEKNSIEYQLRQELRRIQRTTGLAADLEVLWRPNAKRDLSGEVVGNCIFIYDEGLESAKATLKHEVIDFCISQTIQPYKEVTNKLIALINEEAYRRKEQLVENISKLV